ncbi:NADH:ubiquinone oxidoreductase [Vibrio tubiashii]|uniref:NADH:ubiquinone oxidoreductase n=1 Tax=Vibrio tubiashii TaxID=29498 RepID=UPI001EFD1011|nr:NADH:ubiquinone oxidoreductase [Vibrio tubiashii]MCG9576213.1 NADH:ubiquinone oxidoreductase [Vibrio tubiashii]MCG9581071.1 NADH:ubiquinone oxidoreductase [Vibrio tubiashii]MCG9614662.1 NADH:ubiquinone oxidoreductase [Vibrio tubiashii]MCG9687287.1 NADH:ubiquinone oxidoreductase [Vibrio tubiashii]
MKLFIIFMVSISAGVASADHLHSFLLGLYVSTLAVGSCYWFAFRSSRFPQLALLLLLCGLFSKIAVTVAGVSWGISQDLISSPLVFSLSYLFFSLVASYVWFVYREKLMARKKAREELKAA